MSPRFDENEFLARVSALTGLPPTRAVKAVRATLTALRTELDDSERADLAAVLPVSWIDTLRTSDEPHPSGRGEFFERVQAAEHVSVGLAEEHAEAICRALGETLPKRVLKRLDVALPRTVDALFHRSTRA